MSESVIAGDGPPVSSPDRGELLVMPTDYQVWYALATMDYMSATLQLRKLFVNQILVRLDDS